jgi:ankyrin repeat protein
MTTLLIERGADVNLQDSDGNTALMEAVLMDSEAVVRKLLESGADKTLKNSNGRSALDFTGGCSENTKELLESGSQ